MRVCSKIELSNHFRVLAFPSRFMRAISHLSTIIRELTLIVKLYFRDFSKNLRGVRVSVKSKVLQLCEKRNVRVGTLERETGMSNGTIRQWTDESHPSTKTLSKIADYFSIPISDLIEVEQTKEKPDISVELSYAHLELINRIKKMSDEEVALFLRTLDAFQAMQRTVPPQQD